MKKTIDLYEDGRLCRLEYELIRSRRTTCSITVDERGGVTVRAPQRLTAHELERFLQEKSGWILRKQQEQRERWESCPHPDLTNAQRQALEKRYREAARDYIPRRVEHFLPLTGGRYERITIRGQKTRWGSCSSRGTLSFNWRLMLAPPAVLDYVVVHELCHLTVMNHSREFWAKVEGVLPDYRQLRQWLRENGTQLQEAL